MWKEWKLWEAYAFTGSAGESMEDYHRVEASFDKETIAGKAEAEKILTC